MIRLKNETEKPSWKFALCNFSARKPEGLPRAELAQAFKSHLVIASLEGFYFPKKRLKEKLFRQRMVPNLAGKVRDNYTEIGL